MSSLDTVQITGLSRVIHPSVVPVLQFKMASMCSPRKKTADSTHRLNLTFVTLKYFKFLHHFHFHAETSR
jgi:hypothetical protein